MVSGIVVLFSIIAGTICEPMDLAFTQVSFTRFGEPCLNDCINGKCYTSHYAMKNNILKNCFAREELAPTYYTSQTQEKPTCLSRCGKYESDYEWCYVSNDGSWDYCNSDISISWVYNQHQSLHYGPCADSCEFDGKTYMCTTFHKERVQCDPKVKDDFVQARTKYGDKCLDRCRQHSGMRYNNYFCLDLRYGRTKCAPPARLPLLNDYYKKLPSTDCAKGSHKSKRCIHNFHYSAVIETANKIEKSKYFITKKVNETRNPVYSYTVKPPSTVGEAVLPLVVRAKITAATVTPIRQLPRSKQSLESHEKGKFPLPRDRSMSSLPSDVLENLGRMAKLPNDKPRKLIGQYLGGLNKVFNVVPLRRSVRIALQDFDEEIYAWLKRRNTAVDVTIVVIYYRNHPRPDAIAIDLVFWKGDKIVRTHRDQILKNIGLKQEANLIEPVKITSTLRPEKDHTETLDLLQGLA